jgi:hypothetical protein
MVIAPGVKFEEFDGVITTEVDEAIESRKDVVSATFQVLDEVKLPSAADMSVAINFYYFFLK